MTDDTEFVSVRLPADVANWLREYATANNLIRAGKPNMGGSIISAIRERMNGIETMSNNVGQIDIQAIVNTAIAPLIAKIDKLEDDYQHAIINAKHEMRMFVIQGVTGAIDKPYFGIVDNDGDAPDALPIIEAIALAGDKKQVPKKHLLDAQPIIEAIAPDSPAAVIERERLSHKNLSELRKEYRKVIPYEQRNNEKSTKAEYATRDYIIDAILKHQSLTP